MKFSPTSIIRAHRATYRDVRTGHLSWTDLAVAEVAPILLGLIALGFRVRVDPVLAAGLVTVAGLMSAFLFGVLLQISQRAMDWADTHPAPGVETSSHAIFLTELAANAGYASLISIVTAVIFVGGTVGTAPVSIASSALGIAFGTHLVLVLFMVMKRVFALTVSKLNAARTGADVERDARPAETGRGRR